MADGCIRRCSSAWAGNAFTGSGRQSSLNRAGTTGLAGTTQLSRFTPWDYLSPPARLGAGLIGVKRVRPGTGQIHVAGMFGERLRIYYPDDMFLQLEPAALWNRRR